MYEKRITIFIDILGFKSIIQNTKDNTEYATEIFNVLNSITTANIVGEILLEVNNVTVSDELKKDVKDTALIMAEILKKESSIRVTHFSDSIVMSVGLENVMYAMTLIEYLGRLIYRLWRDFKILIRGGVSVDDLVHTENGPLFGPAMINAYEYETYLADVPRIVLDDTMYNIISNYEHVPSIARLFVPFAGINKDKGIEIKRGLEINLGSSFMHYMTSHFTIHPEKKLEVQTEINNSVKHLEAKMNETTSEKIKEKYRYLIEQINDSNLIN